MCDAVGVRLTWLIVGMTAALTACSSNARLAISVATPTPDPSLHEKAVAGVYALARRRDERALLALGIPITTPSPLSSPQRTDGPVVLDAAPSPSAAPSAASSESPAAGALTAAVALSLFLIDRNRYANTFVTDYPTDRDGVVNDYGTDFARADLVKAGSAFPVAALGALVLAGDDGAYAKLLRAATVSNGSLAATYRAQLRHVVMAAAPATTFEVLGSLSPAEQLGAIAGSGWCGNSISRLLAFRPASQSALVSGRVSLLQSAISQSASADCLVAPGVAPRGAQRRARSPGVRVRPIPKRQN
jgi:hypothetical protein